VDVYVLNAIVRRSISLVAIDTRCWVKSFPPWIRLGATMHLSKWPKVLFLLSFFPNYLVFKNILVIFRRKNAEEVSAWGENCCGKCEVRSRRLLRKVEVRHFISEMIHIPNALKFWVKVWCPTHLYTIVLTSNVDDPPGCLSWWPNNFIL
jgi:hypothetical protein